MELSSLTRAKKCRGQGTLLQSPAEPAVAQRRLSPVRQG